MTFLKKLGSFLAKAIAIELGIGPLIAPFLGSGKAGSVTGEVGTVVNDLTAMGQMAVMIETAVQTPGSGPQKLQMLIPLITNIVKTSEMVSGHKIENEALFIKACQGYAQDTVDILNSLSVEKVKAA